MSANLTLLLTNEVGAIQISLIFAVLITFAVALTGMLIGIWCGWFLTGRDLRRARAENDKLREGRDVAQSARTKALNERERAMRDLQGKLHEYSLLEAEHLSVKRQLDQAQAMLRSNEQRNGEQAVLLDAVRTQVDELRGYLISREEALNDRQELVIKLTAQLGEMSNRYAETHHAATERHMSLAATTAELTDTKAKLDQAYETIADMQASLSALASSVQQRRTRLVDANGNASGAVVEVANGTIGTVETYGNTPAAQTARSEPAPDLEHIERMAWLEQQTLALLSELRNARRAPLRR
jgi:predicted  nucleic acid-binding Zn-ribbon protein